MATVVLATGVAASPKDGRSGDMAPAAHDYLERAIAVIGRSLYRNDATWPQMCTEAFAEASGSQVPADTHKAIVTLLRRTNDHHARVIEAPEWKAVIASMPPASAIDFDEHVIGNVAYLHVPSFISRDVDAGNRFSERLAAIVSRHAVRRRGWIVDLRRNGGGSIWAPLLGLGGFFDDGTLGAFRLRDGTLGVWRLDHWQIFAGDGPNGQIDGATLHRVTEGVPVAVLVDATTVSAAEALAIAFKSRRNTRFIGEPTAGYTTGVNTHVLSDGLVINISEVDDVDAGGHDYRNGLVPDDIVKHGDRGDKPLGRALRWIGEQCEISRSARNLGRPTAC